MPLQQGLYPLSKEAPPGVRTPYHGKHTLSTANTYMIYDVKTIAATQNFKGNDEYTDMTIG